ncbi:MAG: ATP-binding protein [Candidatus Enterosoma sp.]|nr:ATP-binding protein [bacterium]MDY5865776.1 ATP-binding protein [Candidatus Enterosoma sp.]
MIVREKYLKEIRPFYDSDLVKIITGIRRCGKSVILKTIYDEIAKITDNIIYLDFEDAFNLKKAGSVELLLSYVDQNRNEGKCYIFLDEVQNVKDWAIAVKTLRLHNNSVFISGSNSKLLSKEFATELSGRYVSFRIRPFVYKEIIEYSKQIGKTISTTDYLIWGGFPKRFDMENSESTVRYLKDLEDTIVIKDLIKRYKIKKPDLFIKFVNFVLRNNSRILSARSIHKYLVGQGVECSSNTILGYMHYLKEAYVIEELPQYSTKVKRELNYNPKVYNSDVCFNSLKVDNKRYDLDHNLENIVYNELEYMGYDLKVFDSKGKEIDFIAMKNGKTYFVQTAYSVVDEKAYKREFGAFADLDNSNQKILITNDAIDYSTSTVRHIKLDDFLLMEEL